MAKIIITGVSRGIGRCLIDYFLSLDGHYVIGLSRETHLDKTASSNETGHGVEFTHISMDICNIEEIDGLINYLQREGIQPDILINNAGMMLNKPFAEITPEEFSRVIEVNLQSLFFLTQKLIPLFARPAHIVNLSSMGGVMGSVKFPGLTLYSASKGALSILTEVLAEELKKSGISVNALALGAVQTEMLREAFPDYQAPNTPEEMAQFIGGFALTGHNFFNGKVLPVAVSTP